MKYVKNKPVRDFTGEQFLKLTLAQEKNLLIITIGDTIEGNTSTSYIDEVKQLYIRDEFSKNVQDWNALRMECVEWVLVKNVLPDLKVELRRTLLEESKECILKACCRKLYNWIKISPYQISFPDEEDDDWDTSKGLRVMAIAYVPDYSKSAFTCIAAPDGDITDHLQLPHLLKRQNSYREDEKVHKVSQLKALRTFIRSKKPHVVCIGGESREALFIAKDIKYIVAELVESEQFPTINVEIIDNQLAKVYANCKKGMSEFPEYPELLRQAASLARKMQDPLIEYSQLGIADGEILGLHFHALQGQISKEELLENLNLEFVNRTNEVGVDINRAIQHPHTSNLVQFICGLGPRKSQALLRLLKQTNQRLENRTQLVTSCHLGPTIFINCSGFVKFDINSFSDSSIETYVEILDGTRVHPESYEWARKMAVDALDYDDDDGDNTAGALEEIVKTPEKLNDLDLNAFVEELERQNLGYKSITLNDITAEFNSPYKDLRAPFASANHRELFDMLTKETLDTFYIGKMITATVTGITYQKPRSERPVKNGLTGLWQCPFCLKNDFPELSDAWNHLNARSCSGQLAGVKLRLDNGISGFIHIKNLTDKYVTNLKDQISIQQLLHCRIIKINAKTLFVECTSKESDLTDENHKWRPAKDPYYDQESDDRTEQEIKNKTKQPYVKRIIPHPAFQNISLAEVEKSMINMDQGGVVIRPSSKGSDHLTVTWKVAENIYQHIDVKEEGKANAFSLGTSLWIDGEKFVDLDEIIGRCIRPMAAQARVLLNFKYCKDIEGGLKDKAEEFLKNKKIENPSKIPYIISASKIYPGKFMLSYLPKSICLHEFITVTPEGFRFRQQIFDSVDNLFIWFKKNSHVLVPGGATPSTPCHSSNAYGGNTPSVNNVNSEAIQRVTQNLPSHTMQTLSAVANQTPLYPHTPGGSATAIPNSLGPSSTSLLVAPWPSWAPIEMFLISKAFVKTLTAEWTSLGISSTRGAVRMTVPDPFIKA